MCCCCHSVGVDAGVVDAVVEGVGRREGLGGGRRQCSGRGLTSCPGELFGADDSINVEIPDVPELVLLHRKPAVQAAPEKQQRGREFLPEKAEIGDENLPRKGWVRCSAVGAGG